MDGYADWQIVLIDVIEKNTLSPGPGLVVQINLSESHLLLFPSLDMIPINYLSQVWILDLCLTVEMYSLWPLTLALAKSRDTTTSETSHEAYLHKTLWNNYSENISLLRLISYIFYSLNTKTIGLVQSIFTTNASLYYHIM